MHIVIVTHYYPPEVNAPAQRAYGHAKVWRAQGHDVTIVTAQPSHPYGKIYEGYENKTAVETQDGIQIVRLKTRLGANKGMLPRSINYASFMLAVWLNKGRIKNADIVISTSPQFFCGYSGVFIARKNKCPWVLEVRDIWPDSIIAVGATKPGLATQLLSKWVDHAYAACDKIVTVSPGFMPHFESRNVPQKKLALLPNGIDTKMVTTPINWGDFPELVLFKGCFIATYIGTIGMAHSVCTLVDAAEILKDRKDIGLLIVGSGAERDTLKAAVTSKKLDNIIFLDQLPRDKILNLFSAISASIVHLKKQDVFKTVIPTKMLEGMALQKPILLGVEGTAAQIVTRAKSGILFEPENASELADAIMHLADNPQDVKAYSQAGRAYVESNYDRTQIAMSYLDVLNTLVRLEN